MPPTPSSSACRLRSRQQDLGRIVDHPFNYPPGHALAGTPLVVADLAAFQKHGNSLARHIFDAVHVVSTRTSDGLKTLSQESSWVTLSLSSFGYDERTVFALKQAIDVLDREAGYTHSDDAKRLKLLSVLQGSGAHADITSRCTAELLDPSLQCRVGGVPGGAPSYTLTATTMSSLWGEGLHQQHA
jgi:hypothetical protein